MALFALVLLGGNAVGASLAGWLAGLAGPYAPFVLGAAGAGATAAWLFRPATRRAVATA